MVSSSSGAADGLLSAAPGSPGRMTFQLLSGRVSERGWRVGGHGKHRGTHVFLLFSVGAPSASGDATLLFSLGWARRWAAAWGGQNTGQRAGAV